MQFLTLKHNYQTDYTVGPRFTGPRFTGPRFTGQNPFPEHPGKSGSDWLLDNPPGFAGWFFSALSTPITRLPWQLNRSKSVNNSFVTIECFMKEQSVA
eukprot:sb/3478875/